MDTLPHDIREHVRVTFPDDGAAVEAILADLESPRVVRCVLHLAGQDLDKLRRMHHAAQQDWRDVIWWAEYDHPHNPEVQIHDFNRPFGASAL